MNTRMSQRLEREAAIIRCAKMLLLEQGYTAFSMERLAAELGIAKGTLYQYVASQDELLLKVLQQQAHDIETLILNRNRAAPSITQLEETMYNAMQYMAVMGREGFDILPLSVKQHETFDHLHKRVLVLVAELVEQAKAERDLALHIPTSIIVYQINSLFFVGYNSVLENSSLSSKEVIRLLIDATFNGIRAERSRHA